MKKIKIQTITTIIVFIFATVLLIGFGAITQFHSYSEYGMEFSDGWNLKYDKTEINDYHFSNELSLDKGADCTVTKRLPDDLQGYDALFFSSQSIAFRVYIDGNEIYSYGYDTGVVESSPGDFVHFVKIPEGSEGKEIKIAIFFPYATPSLMINQINIVNDKEMLVDYVKSKVIPFLICLFMFMLGIVCIICEIILFKRVYGNHCLIYMGAFLIALAVWSLTQVKIIPIIFGKALYNSATSYITLSMLPIPLAMFVIERYSLKKIKTVKILMTVLGILFVSVHILNSLSMWEYAENVILTQIALAVSAFFFIFVSIKYSGNVDNESSRRLMNFAIAFLVVSGIFDIANFYYNKIDDYAFYSRFGLLIFVICIYTDVMISSLKMVKLGEASETNRRLAITDSLTGLYNRTAYDKRLMELVRIPKDKLQFGVIEFDVNNLKKFNDTYGHNMGDTLIIESARIIERSCVNLGIAYRQGGDEFSIIVVDNPHENINRILEIFKQMLNESNERLMWKIPIAIAYGSTVFHLNEDEDIQEVINRADKRMYNMKKSMKENSGNKEIENVLENERNRIAQEMHDTTGHTLTMIQSLINIIETEQIQQNTDSVEERLAQIRELAENGIKELRCSINNIREKKDNNGIIESVQKIASKVEEFYIEICVQGEETERFSEFREAVSDTFREAITNCLRYSNATHMDVIIKFMDKAFEMYIFDNGKGCESIIESDGLKGIRNRIEKFGGIVKFSSVYGEGFQIVIKILL